jgi:hypothetical protein
MRHLESEEALELVGAAAKRKEGSRGSISTNSSHSRTLLIGPRFEDQLP